MFELVEWQTGCDLGDFESEIELAPAVRGLREQARPLVSCLEGRTVWMINSTAKGGGVAEMLPRLVATLHDLGVTVRWVVMAPEEPSFFELTKRIHNLLHGEGDPGMSGDDRALYDRVSEQVSDALADHIAPGDLVVVHDPQPAGVGARLKERVGARVLWRCHIGHDEVTERTEAGWSFLEPYLSAYDHAVFSAPDYVPELLADRYDVISPAIDPFSHKNRPLPPHKLTGVLCNGGLMQAHHPVVTEAFEHRAQRLRADGGFADASGGDGTGLLFRPIVTQISRWDGLKGFAPLLEGFAEMKRRLGQLAVGARDARRLEIARLVLAGPEIGSVVDDPEAAGVFSELSERYQALSAPIRRDVAILQLPMEVAKHNALMVNALQRCSSVVVQNSLREGFGLTVTEAMWKEIAVLGTRACGIRQQMVDGVHGRLLSDPTDPSEIAETLAEMLNAPHDRQHYGSRGRRHVYDELLFFNQARRWLEVLSRGMPAR